MKRKSFDFNSKFDFSFPSKSLEIQNEKFVWLFLNRKNNIFNLTENGGEWRSNNEQIFEHTNITKFLNMFNIGGSGYFHCKLIKKYGIFIPQLIKSSRFQFMIPVLNYLYDKYEQHANQWDSN